MADSGDKTSPFLFLRPQFTVGIFFLFSSVLGINRPNTTNYAFKRPKNSLKKALNIQKSLSTLLLCSFISLSLIYVINSIFFVQVLFHLICDFNVFCLCFFLVYLNKCSLSMSQLHSSHLSMSFDEQKFALMWFIFVLKANICLCELRGKFSLEII